MVRRDRPSFTEWFPQHLERVMPLIDHLHVRIDKSGDDVLPFLEPWGDKVSHDWQFDHPNDNHLEDKERQALLDWALSTGAEWCFSFDSDEVLEEGAGEALRGFIEADPAYRVLIFPLTYSSHHRKGYLLDRDETSISVGRGYRLSDPEIRNFRYVGDKDGLHCGTLPSQDRRSATMKEIHTIHYHATTPAEFMHKRNFYDNTHEVRRFGGIEWLYRCDRFGSERNAKPYDKVVTNVEERFALLPARAERSHKVFKR